MTFLFKIWDQGSSGEPMAIRVASVAELRRLSRALPGPDTGSNWSSLADYLAASAGATSPPVPFTRMVDVLWTRTRRPASATATAATTRPLACGGSPSGARFSTVRSGSRPRLHAFGHWKDEVDWVVSQLDPDDPDIDGTAILVMSNRVVDQWRERLAAHGLGSVPVGEYKGRPVPGVKVGTYHRAKGLEFKRLFLPGLDDAYPPGDRDDADELIEKGSLLYVAMSRARDELDISYSGRPSMFLDAILPFVESEGVAA